MLDLVSGFTAEFLINAENGQIKGNLHGVTSSAVQKVWLSAQAIGDIAFAYNYNIILLNIQVRNALTIRFPILIVLSFVRNF